MMARTSTRKPRKRSRATKTRRPRPTILLVDSEALLRMTLSGFLQDCGFKVFEASSASDAVEVLSHGDVHIDLVMCDVALSGEMDGFMLARRVKDNRRELKVVLTAGDGNRVSRAQKLCAGEPFFAKPCDLKRIVAELRASLTPWGY